MDVPAAFVRLLDNVLWTIDEEYRLMEEILLDDDGGDEILVANFPGEDLHYVLEAVIGRFLQLEIMAMFVEDDDEDVLEIVDGQNPRRINWTFNLPKVQQFRLMEDYTFHQHFRMNKNVFELLVLELGHHLTTHNRLIRMRIQLDLCVMMSVWILCNLESFRAVGELFGLSRSVVHHHYVLIIEALRELSPKFIKWPSQIERERIKMVCEARSGYPGIVGMIDGTLIKITAPAIQRERYLDRHQSYSMNVQAVCDHNLLVRDLYVGQPGSMHDSRVFKNSPLHDLFLRGQQLMLEDEHIIGDGGYTQTDKLLIPYRDNGQLTHRQRRFNYLHSSVRMYVERLFGRLKGKMRRLLNLYVRRFEYGVDHIISSFVLSNFIILEGRESDGICVHQVNVAPAGVEEFEEEADDPDLPHIQDPNAEVVPHVENDGNVVDRVQEDPLFTAAKARGLVKRDAIAIQIVPDP